MELPILNSKEKYRIILRQQGFNKSKEFLKRNFTGGSFPKIITSNHCICCYVNTTHFKNIDPVLNDQKLLEPFQLPVCNNCEHHAIIDTQTTLVSGILMVVGILGALASIILFVNAKVNCLEELILLLIAFSVAYFGFKVWKKHMHKFGENMKGHSPGASFVVRYHDEIIIETGNSQFAHEIIKNHHNLVFKVEKNTDKLTR